MEVKKEVVATLHQNRKMERGRYRDDIFLFVIC